MATPRTTRIKPPVEKNIETKQFEEIFDEFHSRKVEKKSYVKANRINYGKDFL